MALRGMAFLLALVTGPAVRAEEKNTSETARPTIQRRFALKKNRVYAHATGTVPIRNDFYDSLGAGVDAGYYPFESLAVEVRWSWLRTRLSDAALSVKDESGLVPDARAQRMLFMAGARYSFGYGKVLLFESLVVHFDPQLTAHAGIALAESRVLPTVTAGISLVTHLKWGLQAKIDLAAQFQMEDRSRGWVPTLGFLPVLGVGWSPSRSVPSRGAPE